MGERCHAPAARARRRPRPDRPSRGGERAPSSKVCDEIGETGAEIARDGLMRLGERGRCCAVCASTPMEIGRAAGLRPRRPSSARRSAGRGRAPRVSWIAGDAGGGDLRRRAPADGGDAQLAFSSKVCVNAAMRWSRSRATASCVAGDLRGRRRRRGRRWPRPARRRVILERLRQRGDALSRSLRHGCRDAGGDVRSGFVGAVADGGQVRKARVLVERLRPTRRCAESRSLRDAVVRVGDAGRRRLRRGRRSRRPPGARCPRRFARAPRCARRDRARRVVGVGDPGGRAVGALAERRERAAARRRRSRARAGRTCRRDRAPRSHAFRRGATAAASARSSRRADERAGRRLRGPRAGR